MFTITDNFNYTAPVAGDDFNSDDLAIVFYPFYLDF